MKPHDTAKAHKAWTFRDHARTGKHQAIGLPALAPQFRAEHQAYRAHYERVGQLHRTILEPSIRILDQPAPREALRQLRELHRQSRKPLTVPKRDFSAAINPLVISTNPGYADGTAVATPPLDFAWTSTPGSPNLSADATTGVVSLSMNDTTDKVVFGAGVGVWVVPEYSTSTVLLIPEINVNSFWFLYTGFGSGQPAASIGKLNVLIRSHDASGNVIDSLTQDVRNQLWNVELAQQALPQSLDGQNNFYNLSPSAPLFNWAFFLTGGTFYEVWIWIQLFGAGETDYSAGPGLEPPDPFLGLAESVGYLSAKVDLIACTEYPAGSSN
jgi:hypothetical protein